MPKRCPTGKKLMHGKCVDIERAMIKSCPSGQSYDKKQKACVPSLVAELDDYDMFEDEMDWGSSQYTGASKAYHVFMEHYHKNGNDLNKTIAEFKKAGVDIKIDKTSKKAALGSVHDLLEEDLDEDDEEEEASFMSEVKNFDDAFKFAKEEAWDLWGAAPTFGEAAGIHVTAPKSRGSGPVGNIEVQGENLTTGIYCAVLKAMGYVKSEESFKDFDT